MANPRWIGSAAAIADVWTLTVGGTIEATDIFIVTIGSKSLSVVGGLTDADDVASAIVTAYNALSATTYPEFKEYTAAAVGSGGELTLTHNTPGIPGTVSVSTTETGGGAADDQTFSASNSTPATGPNFWSNAGNWDTGAVPVNSDNVYFENNAIDCLYGLDQSAVTLASLNIAKSYTGKIGLPRIRGSATNGYYEYRAQYLAVSATLLKIGYGDGTGSQRIKIDTGSNATTITVSGSGQRIESDLPAILWKGAHASNALSITEGDFGAAVFATETATLSGGVSVGFENSPDSDAKIKIGSGVTLSGTIVQSGGYIENYCAVTTVTRYGGKMLHDSANITTLSNLGGEFQWNGTGTITTATNAAKFRKIGLAAGTITNGVNMYKGSEWSDPYKTITYDSSPSSFTCVNCHLNEIKIDIGVNTSFIVV